MKKVSLDKFFDYKITGHRYKVPRIVSWRYFFHNNINFLYPKPLFIISLVLVFTASIFNDSALKLGLALLSVYIYQGICARKLKSNLKIRRKNVPKSKEGRFEDFGMAVENPNAYPFFNLLILDHIEANQRSSDNLSSHLFIKKLEPQQKTIHSNILEMNNGMGIKKVGPFIALVTDELGLNRLTYINDTITEIKIYPLVLPTKRPKLLPDLQDLTFGEFDTFKKGNNINFYSTKEYQEGDNVNRINWKLSLKSNQLIVNEFENNTNVKVQAVLNNDERLHFGEGNLSSFEYCKDLLLSLFYANVRSNNNLGVITHQKVIKPQVGKKHLTAMELFIANCQLEESDKASVYSKRTTVFNDINYFHKKIEFNVDEESNLYFFTGFIPGKFWDAHFNRLKILRKKVKHLHLIIVYGFEEMIPKVSEVEKSWLTKINVQATQEIPQIIANAKKEGIACSVIKINQKIKYPSLIKEGFSIAK